MSGFAVFSIVLNLSTQSITLMRKGLSPPYLEENMHCIWFFFVI